MKIRPEDVTLRWFRRFAECLSVCEASLTIRTQQAVSDELWIFGDEEELKKETSKSVVKNLFFELFDVPALMEIESQLQDGIYSPDSTSLSLALKNLHAYIEKRQETLRVGK